MFDTADTNSRPRRRYWLAEALLVVAILAFGGFALLSEARVSPTELLSGFSDIVAR